MEANHIAGKTVPVVAGQFKMTARIEPLRSDRSLVKLHLPGNRVVAARTAVINRCLRTGVAYRWASSSR